MAWSLLAPSVVIAAPAPSFAVDYLTTEQALAEAFPEAQTFELRAVSLSPEQLGLLRQRLGEPVRKASWTARIARKDSTALGVLVVDEVIGKSERITYAVGINKNGAIRSVEILSYRESHGQEVRLPAWRRQFAGKTAASPLRVGEDIANISGATLSCSHVTAGVRQIVAVVEALREAGELE
ncbi:MAG TPA: FMN-binding protein [Anaeromyxobacter sp.]|nr:FMN-binding protein [Anaeromyxobacter sp.]